MSDNIDNMARIEREIEKKMEADYEQFLRHMINRINRIKVAGDSRVRAERKSPVAYFNHKTINSVNSVNDVSKQKSTESF